MPKTGFALSAPMPIGEVVEIAQAAEARGFESFWLTEGAGGRDAVAQLAFVAAATRRIKLGTGILTIYSRTAPAMAQIAASMNELSNGRFLLGLGTGHKAMIERSLGVPFNKPGSRMRDYLHVIRTALKDGRVSYQGQAISLPEFRMMRSAAPPAPVYVACLGGALAELSGELADGVVPLMANPRGIAALREAIARGAARVGRDQSSIDVGCFIVACASDDPSAAEAEGRRQIARYGAMPFYQRMLSISGFSDEIKRFREAQANGNQSRLPDLVSDRMLESLVLLGKPDRWLSLLRDFRAAGVTHPVVYAVPVGPDGKASLLQATRTLAAGGLG